MSVKLVCTNYDEENMQNTTIEAVDLTTNEAVSAKMWFEKSKDKWHIVLGANSANRKYIVFNEFSNNQNEDGEYIVEDKTTGPRVLGTSQPDRKLVPFMTPEDKAEYDAIIERAIANKNSQKAAPLTEEEKLERQIAKLQAKLAAAKENADVE